MSEFNAEQIELLGISKVKEAFTLMGYCRPYVNDADKIPIWDGELFVYKTFNDFSKANLDFKIPLQVKSTYSDKLPKSSRFQVDIADLKAYLTDRGVLFIHVLINKDKHQIYCGYLNKSELEKYVSVAEKKSKSTTVVKFSRIPKTFKDIYKELRTLHLQRQLNKISIDELEHLHGAKYKFCVQHISPDDDLLLHLASNSVDILVECDGFSDPFYLGDGRAYLKFIEEIDKPISVDNIVYFNSFKRTPSKDGYNITIGKSTHFLITPDKNNAGKYIINVTVKLAHDGTIEDIIKELKFSIASFEHKGFFIGETWQSYADLDDSNKEALDIWKSQLQFWLDTQTLFAKLGIEEPLNINQMDEKGQKDLRTLIDAFIYDKRVVGVDMDSHTSTFVIGNINIIVFAEHIEGKYFRLKDIYDGLIVSTQSANGEQVIISPFMIPYLPWLEILPDNIPTAKIEQSYDNISRLNPQIQDFAVENLLAMLLAFDKSNRKIHLHGAEILSRWLLRNSYDAKSQIIYKLNCYQTILRSRSLNNDELDDIADIALESTDKSISVAANALLNNSALVKKMWSSLSKESQSDMERRPIYKYIQPHI